MYGGRQRRRRRPNSEFGGGFLENFIVGERELNKRVKIRWFLKESLDNFGEIAWLLTTANDGMGWSLTLETEIAVTDCLCLSVLYFFAIWWKKGEDERGRDAINVEIFFNILYYYLLKKTKRAKVDLGVNLRGQMEH